MVSRVCVTFNFYPKLVENVCMSYLCFVSVFCSTCPMLIEICTVCPSGASWCITLCEQPVELSLTKLTSNISVQTIFKYYSESLIC